MTPTRIRTATILAALAGLAALAASPAQGASSAYTSTCGVAVVNDWFADGRVDGTYPVGCYTQAIARVEKYEDVRAYSSAADDIRRAMLAAIRQERGGGASKSDVNGGPSGDSSGDGQNGGGIVGPGGGGGGGNGGGGSGGAHRGAVTKLIDKLGPSNAESVPLPLLVLGGIALLLLLTSGATFLARRVQARRPQVAAATPPGPKRP